MGEVEGRRHYLNNHWLSRQWSSHALMGESVALIITIDNILVRTMGNHCGMYESCISLHDCIYR